MSLKKKCKSFFRTGRDLPEPVPETENSVEGIYLSLDKAELESSLEGTYPLLREIMDARQ